jgi:hypothetical protein
MYACYYMSALCANIDTQRNGRGEPVDQYPANAGANDAGHRIGGGKQALRIHQVRAPHQVGQIHMGGAAADNHAQAEQKADHIQPVYGQDAKPPGKRDRTQYEWEQELRPKQDRELGAPIQPNVNGQAKQEKRQALQRQHGARLGRACVQHQYRRERNRQGGDLFAKTIERATQPKATKIPLLQHSVRHEFFV